MSKVVSIEAKSRAAAALRCVEYLVPSAAPHRKQALASRILAMCHRERFGHTTIRRKEVSQGQMFEAVVRNSQCLKHNCPLLIFAEPLARELNEFFGEED